MGNLLTVETPDELDTGEDSSESILSCLLLNSNANVNSQDNYGSTPLHYAAVKGNPRSIEEMIKYSRVEVNVSSFIFITVIVITQ